MGLDGVTDGDAAGIVILGHDPEHHAALTVVDVLVDRVVQRFVGKAIERILTIEAWNGSKFQVSIAEGRAVGVATGQVGGDGLAVKGETERQIAVQPLFGSGNPAIDDVLSNLVSTVFARKQRGD